MKLPAPKAVELSRPVMACKYSRNGTNLRKVTCSFEYYGKISDLPLIEAIRKVVKWAVLHRPHPMAGGLGMKSQSAYSI
jgi:hypothetical protein